MSFFGGEAFFTTFLLLKPAYFTPLPVTLLVGGGGGKTQQQGRVAGSVKVCTIMVIMLSLKSIVLHSGGKKRAVS